MSILADEIDKVVLAMRAARRATVRIAEANDELRKTLESLDTELRIVSGFAFEDKKVREKLESLQRRVQDLRYTRNGMELGVFQIQVEKVMEEAYRDLP